MAFIAKSVTFFYDIEQDRLNMIFTDKDKGQLIGVMTRHFFKGLLTQLPIWLTEQRADIIPPTAEQQKAINQIHHQVSQQEVAVTYGKVLPNKQLGTFLINTINFTKTKAKSESGVQKIRLEFLNQNKTTEIIIVLNSAQLHKLIGEILKQVKTWDLDNPWRLESKVSVSIDAKDRMMH